MASDQDEISLRFKELERLAEEVEEALRDLPSLWKDVDAVLHAAQQGSRQARTLGLFTEVRGRHIDIVRILQALPAAMEQFEIKKSISKLMDGFHRVQHALGTLDPERIADEALFVAQQKTAEKVFRAPKDIPNAYASAQAQVFVFAPAYNNLLCTFLQRPTRFVATVEALKALGKAALGELAGKVLPLGILQALQDISVPHADREAARFNQAAGVMDRVFELDESLLELAEQAKLAVVAVTALKAEFEREEEAFESNVDWLLDLYAAATRT